MAKIIIKYFGKDEYAPLEEILDPQNISSYDLSEFQPPVSDLFYILDDFIKDIICDLYNDGWDFTKDIDFLEIVGE